MTRLTSFTGDYCLKLYYFTSYALAIDAKPFLQVYFAFSLSCLHYFLLSDLYFVFTHVV